MVSAVPAGEVMALDEVLGVIRPCAAATGATISEVRLPGTPPMQCLSATRGRFQVSRRPAPAMARVRARVSSAVMKLAQATRKAEISMSDQRLSARSWTTSSIWAAVRVSPAILARRAAAPFGGGAGVIRTAAPAGTPSRRKAGSVSPASSGPTRAGSSQITTEAIRVRPPALTSTLRTPASRSGRRAWQSRDRSTVFSRKVSMARGRTVSCMRVSGDDHRPL